jgi:hypothetical protein
MSEQTTPSVPALDATRSSWPTYALRAWLTAMLTQTLQAEIQIKHRIEDIEIEAARLRAQLARATPVIESLQQSIRKVDDVLRHRRDVDRADMAASGPRRTTDDASHSETSPTETSRSETSRSETAAGPPEKHESGGRGKHKR